jgi:hypothetical protein
MSFSLLTEHSLGVKEVTVRQRNMRFLETRFALLFRALKRLKSKSSQISL